MVSDAKTRWGGRQKSGKIQPQGSAKRSTFDGFKFVPGAAKKRQRIR